MACHHRHVAEPLAEVLVAAEEPDLRGNRVTREVPWHGKRIAHMCDGAVGDALAFFHPDATSQGCTSAPSTRRQRASGLPSCSAAGRRPSGRSW